MNSLISIRTNIFYTKNTEEEYVRQQEIVLLIDKPKYKYSNEGEVLRERGIEELRFVVTDDSMGQLIDALSAIRGVDEKDLK